LFVTDRAELQRIPYPRNPDAAVAQRRTRGIPPYLKGGKAALVWVRRRGKRGKGRGGGDRESTLVCCSPLARLPLKNGFINKERDAPKCQKKEKEMKGCPMGKKGNF